MRKIMIMFSFLSTCFISLAQNNTGLFEASIDIGNPKNKGLTIYDPVKQEYTLQGAGTNMWGNQDQFHFLHKKIKGDFIITATIRFVGRGTDPHRKIGIMARDQLTPGSRYADACVHGDILSSLQYRTENDGNTSEVAVSSFHPSHISLERKGNTFIFSSATEGENYKSAEKEIRLNDEVYAGLFICSHNENVTEKAIFSNVRIIIPPKPGYQPYRDFIGSDLEVIDIKTGLRKILLHDNGSIQAPNWTPDGQHLIFNSAGGLLYKYHFRNKSVEKLNTGFAVNNNNDHVLSFEGKMLALSNHQGKNSISTIYIMPVTGSDKPVQITSDTAHSYLHGWSPDGRKLVFTGQRNNQFDIWQVDIKSKKETQLTNQPTLDDGPEYSPDGKWIYFNSVRTGTMKIWRMKPDGSNQEQVTYDEYNDWFPHFSPDGKWIVYLSFPKDIDPSSHPFYQKVYLRLMPASGGVPKTIAYIYGGQGTINVPSWSPDSRQVAFVSNTDNK